MNVPRSHPHRHQSGRNEKSYFHFLVNSNKISNRLLNVAVLAAVRVCLLSDCSVCSEGYATTLAFTCSKCSGGNAAAIVVLSAIALLAALLILKHLVSIKQETITGGAVVRVGWFLPVQSIKIVIIAWQIITQVITRKAPLPNDLE